MRKLLTVDIDEELLDTFIEYVAENGTTRSNVVEKLIRGLVRGEIQCADK